VEARRVVILKQAGTDAKGTESASPFVLVLCDELARQALKPVANLTVGDRDIEILEGRDALWAVVRRKSRGGLAVRTVHLVGEAISIKRRKAGLGEAIRFEIESAVGTHLVVFRLRAPDLAVLRVTVSLKPNAPLTIPFTPRDLYPLGEDDNPLRAMGQIEAAQRGLNSGVLYFHIDTPAFGTVL
jgi:hypothetical protein